MSLKSDLTKADRAYNRLINRNAKALLIAYKESLREIQSMTAEFYRKYAGKEGTMTLAEAVKYNRLRNLESGITREIVRLGNEQVGITRTALRTVYTDSYYRQGFAIDNYIRAEFKAYLQFGLLPKEQIAAAVNNPLDMITAWPERARNNIQLMRRNISDSITRGIIQGKSYPQMANEIKDWYDKGAWQADRIIRTEGHRVREQGTQNSFEQAEAEGVEMKKRWMSALDTNTRDEHGAADGQEVNVDEPFVVGGEQLEYPGDPSGSAWNVINCRCSSEPIVNDFKPDTRRVRLTDEEYERRLDEAGGDKSKVSRSEVVPYQTYDQWAEDKGIKR
jgi:SPP1 gp7 family putative phage head morphogenesis protein